jgi:antitoxin component YwqK of YwqJK toxin-antitoxin module
LQVRLKRNGTSLSYLPFDQVPFTGWRKSFHPNGQLPILQQYKDGIQHGSAMEWYSKGQMKWQIKVDFNKVMSAKAWTPDGAPCPITRVVNGNGIGVIYDESGSITLRKRWDNGKEINPFKK